MTTPMHDAFAKLLGDILGRRWFAARHAKTARQDVSSPPDTAPLPIPGMANDTGAVSGEQNDEGPPRKEPAP